MRYTPQRKANATQIACNNAGETWRLAEGEKKMWVQVVVHTLPGELENV